MKNSILSLEGVEVLSKNQQKNVYGGKVAPEEAGGGRNCNMIEGSQEGVYSAGVLVSVVCTWTCRNTFLGFSVGSSYNIQSGCGMMGTH
ncbi:MAG: hypothetical protein ACI9FW_001250 [Flavobacterium sp.]|jgi:hypothetical protein